VWIIIFVLITTSLHTAAARENSLAARADEARDADRLDEAVGLYRRALSLHPSWAEGWWSLGTIQYDRNAYFDAAAAFRKVTRLTPRNGTAFAMLGLCEFELDQPEFALKHLQRGRILGLQRDPALWRVVLFHEGTLLQRKESFQAAQDSLGELCRQGGQGDETARILGMTMLRMASRASRPLSLTDLEIIRRIGNAECLASQKKYEEAQPLFERVVADNPNFPNIHFAYGLFLLEILDIARAVEQFRLEIKNDPTNVPARLRIAAALYKQDSAAAIPYAQEATQLAPQLGFAHYLLGLLLLDTDHFRDAIPELEKAKKVFPREAKLYLALGSAYSRAGRKREAASARSTFTRLTKEGSPLSEDGIGAQDSVPGHFEKQESTPP
jgi:tetratricopeptide (TPR) repeat protein